MKIFSRMFHKPLRWTALPVAAAAILVVAPPPLAAQSFVEPGARAAGMGGAFAALADDTSALFYNPAGLVQLSGVRAKVNLLMGVPSTSVTGVPGGGPLSSRPFVFRGSAALSWRFWKHGAVGIGFHSPQDIAADWPGGWAGSAICLSARNSQSRFRSALSFEIFRGLSIGAGVDLVSSKLWWTRVDPFPSSPKIQQSVHVESRFDLKGRGTGFVAGLLWKVHPAVRVAMNYQTGAAVDLAGRNFFIIMETLMTSDKVPGPYGGLISLTDVLRKFYPSTNVTGRLTSPAQASVGVMLTPFSRLSVLLEAQQTRWREFGRWEFRSETQGLDLSPEFNADYRSFYGISPGFGVQSAGLNLRDVWDFKAGLEFRPGTHFALRSGFASHGSPSAPGYLNPVDADLGQNIVSLGFGYEGPLFSVYDNRQVSELSFDIFLRYGFSGKTQSALPGYEFAYAAHAWVAGVGVGFNF